MNEVEKYFNAEKIFCLFGAIFGFISLLLAAYFLFKIKQPFYTGMSYPFIALGLFFLIICGSVFVRSPKDVIRVNSMLKNERTLIQTEELPRMEKVIKNFGVIIIVEIIFIVVSLGGIFFINSGLQLRGIFTGILIQSSFLLVFDVLAHHRGKIYFDFLKGIQGS